MKQVFLGSLLAKAHLLRCPPRPLLAAYGPSTPQSGLSGRLASGTFLNKLLLKMVSKQIPCVILLLLAFGCSKPLPLLGEIPHFSLLNQEGESISREDLLDSEWIANFIYTGCSDICPMLTAKMGRLGKELQKAALFDIRLVTFSVDPENDTPERLKAYRERFEGDKLNWLFLTGPLSEIEKTVIDGFHLTMKRNPEEPASILHMEKFVLVDKKGQIRGYYDVDRLQDLLKALKKLKRNKAP